MAFNSFLGRATSSMIPLSRRSAEKLCVVGGVQFLPFLQFSTTTATDKNIASLLESAFKPDPKAISTNTADYPFKKIFFLDSNMVLSRSVQNELTRIVFLGDTYKVNEYGNPSISMEAVVRLGYLQAAFEATAEAKMIRIQGIKMSDDPSCGHLSVFEEYLGTRGINARNMGVLFNCFRKKQKESVAKSC